MRRNFTKNRLPDRFEPTDREGTDNLEDTDEDGSDGSREMEERKTRPRRLRPKTANMDAREPWGCTICGRDGQEDRCILCDRCDKPYHFDCLRPRLTKLPEGEWFCYVCSVLLQWQSEAGLESEEENEFDSEAETTTEKHTKFQRQKMRGDGARQVKGQIVKTPKIRKRKDRSKMERRESTAPLSSSSSSIPLPSGKLRLKHRKCLGGHAVELDKPPVCVHDESHVDLDALRQLLKRGKSPQYLGPQALSDDHRQRTLCYLNERDRHPDSSHLVEYRYAYGRHDGNLYASAGNGGHGVSAQILPRSVRDIACHRFVDIDMECANQTMLLARFLDCGMTVPHVLKQYLQDKNGIRAMLAAHYNCSNEGAKKLLNMHSYGAGFRAINEWREEFSVSSVQHEHPYVTQYRQMITCATEKLVMEEDVEFAKFKQNPRRSALSEICSRYQAQVLDFALKRLESRWGFARRTSILMFDGVMVVAQDVSDEVLNDLHAAGFKELGIWVRWACKSPKCDGTRTTTILDLPLNPKAHRSRLVEERAWDPYE